MCHFQFTLVCIHPSTNLPTNYLPPISHLPTYKLSYLPPTTSLPTYQFIYLHNYLPLTSHIPSYIPTYLSTYLRALYFVPTQIFPPSYLLFLQHTYLSIYLPRSTHLPFTSYNLPTYLLWTTNYLLTYPFYIPTIVQPTY